MRVVCYSRTSTMDQAREEKVSIPDQIQWAKQECMEHGWYWVKEYIEPGIFGDVEPEDRKAMNEMLEDAKKDMFDLILVYHSSRFAREPDVGMRACRLLGTQGKQVYFRNAPVEPMTPKKFSWGANIGNMYMQAFSFIGDFQENVARGERVRSGFRGLAKRGKLVFAPYGYIKIPKVIRDHEDRQRYEWKFEIDQPKEIIVKRIFNEYVNKGGSIRNIMLSLNSDNIPSPSGKAGQEAWSTATIRNILTNPAYTGKVRWGRKLGGKYKQGKTANGKQKRTITSPEEWILTNGDHPPIITKNTFDTAQRKLKIRSTMKGRAVASAGLLTGLVYCGKCGRKAIIKRRKSRYRRTTINYACQSYYRHKSCQRHIMSADKLHAAIIEEINRIAKDKKYREQLLSHSREDSNIKSGKRLKAIERDIKKIEKKQLRLLNAYEGGHLTLQQFGERKKTHDTDIELLLEEKIKIETDITNEQKHTEAKKKFEKVLENLPDRIKETEFSKQKDLMHALIERINVNNPHINISFRLS